MNSKGNDNLNFLEFIKKYKIFQHKNLFLKIEKIKIDLKNNQEWNQEKIEILKLLNNSFSEQNFSKTRKHKIIYFLYATHIFISENFLSNKKSVFFKNEEKKIWTFKENGPSLCQITDFKKDIDKIFLNWKDFSEKEIILFKKTIDILLSFSTQKLILESNKTFSIIKKEQSLKENIIYNQNLKKYFKNNPPFFIY